MTGCRPLSLAALCLWSAASAFTLSAQVAVQPATVDGVRTVSHTGGAMGGSTILLLHPDRGIVVAILTNLQSVRHVETARAVADLFWAARSQQDTGADR